MESKTASVKICFVSVEKADPHNWSTYLWQAVSSKPVDQKWSTFHENFRWAISNWLAWWIRIHYVDQYPLWPTNWTLQKCPDFMIMTIYESTKQGGSIETNVIDIARTVWEKNEVNFWSEINVNLIIFGLVGFGTSSWVSNTLSYQEGSPCKVLNQKSKRSSNYLRLTKSAKIAIMALL